MTADEYPECSQCGERHPPEQNEKLKALLTGVFAELRKDEYSADDVLKFAATFVHYAFRDEKVEARHYILGVFLSALDIVPPEFLSPVPPNTTVH